MNWLFGVAAVIVIVIEFAIFTTRQHARALRSQMVNTPPGIAASGSLPEQTDVAFVQFQPGTAFEPSRQNHCPVSDADQAAYGVADRLDHPANFTIPPFRNGDPIPAIRPFTAALFDRTKTGNAVFERDTVEQLLLFFTAQLAEDPHRVFTLQPKTRVHQIVGQSA